ncbi:MAG TPA: DciA family protein [Telluria sp.]
MHIFGTRVRNTSIGATDFLRQNDKIASLLPTALRMGNLQRDCAAALPAMFAACDVLSFQDSALVLAVPSSAFAARLKQQLPKLQGALQQRGWQVESVRLKVQVTRATPPEQQMRNLELPPAAVTAFEELGEALPDTPQNAGLIAALRSMAARRKG